MRDHKWKRIFGVFASAALATLISGCHTVHSGAPHPFTTMFRKGTEVNHFASPTESIPATAGPATQNDHSGGS
ncbi:MAG: hypothetical protein P8K08_17785 [Fuerstiella sp.]|jgi:hypothetical protein|nr:hypothetical protein [Fuerstiella sp.]